MEPWNNGAEIIGSITSRAPSESQWKRSFHLSAQGIKSQSRQRPSHSYPFVSKPRAITARNCDRAKPGNLETIFPSFPPRDVPKLKYSADVGNESSKTDRIKREGGKLPGGNQPFPCLTSISQRERERAGKPRKNPFVSAIVNRSKTKLPLLGSSDRALRRGYGEGLFPPFPSSFSLSLDLLFPIFIRIPIPFGFMAKDSGREMGN